MKNMALLIDTNVVLDFVLKRELFHEASSTVMDLCIKNKVRGYLAAHSLTNVFYITRKDIDLEGRKEIIRIFCKHFRIASINRVNIMRVLDGANFKDLEDSLQIECAYAKNVDYIITRDAKGFVDSKIPAITPEDFLAIWSGQGAC